mgnify:CR=1 FL=1
MKKHDRSYIRPYLRAGAKLGFFIHLAAYVTVNALLVFINYSTTPQHLWFKWPLVGWGIGLFFHWLAIFVGPSLMQTFYNRELDKDRLDD